MHSIDNPQETKLHKRVFAMAGLSFSKYVKKVCGLLVIMPILALTGCGEGDGPIGIKNTAVPPLNLPPGFCERINITFEIDCEPPEIIWFGGGQTVVIDNPDKSGINQSDKVARMQKFFDQVFGGTRLNPIAVPVDFSQGRAFKMKVWSEREVPISFKLEEFNDGSGGVTQIVSHGGGSVWEELCFDFTPAVPPNPTIGLTIIFDDGVQGGAIADVFSGDWTFYYDDITQVESCSDTAPTGIVPDVKVYDPTATPPVPADVEVTPFGSQSVINDMYADDASYSPVLAVSSGVGYGANVAQVGFIGFDPGFVTFYETLDFKVKGLPNSVLFVSLYEGGDPLRINLSSSGLSEALGDGWYQVSIQISSFTGLTTATGIVFESDNTAPMQFTFFLNDIGFSEADDEGGNGGGGPFDDGLLTNGDFEAGVNPWLLGTDNPIGAENVIDENGNSVFFVDVTAAGNSFDVNLSQKLAITPGETYTLSFKAKSNVARSMLAGLGQSGGDFYSATQSVNLTTDWQTIEIEVTATDDNGGGDFGEADSRVLFDMGAEIGEVFIDDVSLVVAGSGGGAPFDDGLLTNGDFEAGVSPWLLGVDNPIGAENVIDESGNSVFFVDVTAAGNSFDVNLSQKLAITPGETYTLSFKAKSNVARSMLAGLGQSGGDFYSATQSVNLTTDWQTFELDVTATDDNGGGDFGEADSRVLFDMGAEIGEVFIDDVSLVVSGGGNGGGTGDGGLVPDGGFEAAGTAGLQPPWFVDELGGTVSVSNANSNGGTYAARLQADASSGSPSFPILKVERVGAGTLTGGAPVTVQFDAIDVDSTGVGKTFVAEFFTERADPPGGATNEVLLGGYGLSGSWQTFTYNTVLGADAAGGVSLLFKADCGANTACTMDVFIDNVSIVVN
jgi:hypothetical protein